MSGGRGEGFNIASGVETCKIVSTGNALSFLIGLSFDVVPVIFKGSKGASSKELKKLTFETLTMPRVLRLMLLLEWLSKDSCSSA